LARVAVLGGSFNPIHHGHLLLADEILEILGVDRVLFVPAAVPPHKAPADLAPAADRFAMVQLAIAGHPGFAVSDLELRRPGPSYSVFFVIGSETFLDLLSWREPRRIASLVRLVVIPRAGSPFDPQSAAAQKVLREIGIGESGFAHVGPGGGPPPRAVLIAHVTSLPISASDLRARVRAGRSLDYRLPPAVIDYVRGHRLYQAEPA
jgi:nicotinate-nucleotide adenylyltransferase